MEEFLFDISPSSPLDAVYETLSIAYLRKRFDSRRITGRLLRKWRYRFKPTPDTIRILKKMGKMRRESTVEKLKNNQTVAMGKLSKFVSKEWKNYSLDSPKREISIPKPPVSPELISRFSLPNQQGGNLLIDQGINPLQRLQKIRDVPPRSKTTMSERKKQEDVMGALDDVYGINKVFTSTLKKAKGSVVEDNKPKTTAHGDNLEEELDPDDSLGVFFIPPMGLPTKVEPKESLLPLDLTESLSFLRVETLYIRSAFAYLSPKIIEKSMGMLAVVDELLRFFIYKLIGSKVEYISVEVYYSSLTELLYSFHDIKREIPPHSLLFLSTFDYISGPYQRRPWIFSLVLFHLKLAMKLIFACVNSDLNPRKIINRKLLPAIFDLSLLSTSLRSYIEQIVNLFLESFENFAKEVRKQGVRYDKSYYLSLGLIPCDDPNTEYRPSDIMATSGIYLNTPSLILMIDLDNSSLGLTKAKLFKWIEGVDLTDLSRISLPTIPLSLIKELATILGTESDVLASFSDKIFISAPPDVMNLFDANIEVLHPLDVIQITTDGSHVELLRQPRDELYMNSAVFDKPVLNHGVRPHPCYMVPSVNFKIETLGTSCAPDFFSVMEKLSTPHLGAGNQILVTLLFPKQETCYVSVRLWERQFNITFEDRLAVLLFAHNLIREIEKTYRVFD